MKRDYYKGIINVLLELHKAHPNYELGKHLEMAFSEYPSPWGIPDKEMLEALKKYKEQISQEKDITDDYINQIMKDAENLDTILDENEEYE